MHERMIVHNNITLHSIYITESKNVKIGDFMKSEKHNSNFEIGTADTSSAV